MKIFVFLITLVMFIGGIVVMAYSFTPEGFDGYLFVASLLLVSLAYFIPVHVLKWVDRS
jgi:hypothetical protein